MFARNVVFILGLPGGNKTRRVQGRTMAIKAGQLVVRRETERLGRRTPDPEPVTAALSIVRAETCCRQ